MLDIYNCIFHRFDERLTVISLDTSVIPEDNFYGYAFYTEEHFINLLAKSQEITKKFSGLH